MVSKEVLATMSTPRIAPYDPAASPGPIPSVIDRFRPRYDDPATPAPDTVEAELARYAVVLVTPEAAEDLGYLRGDPGLKLYIDDEYEADMPYLEEAARVIEDECGVPVALVEHHADLTYWTARRRDPARAGVTS